MGIVNILSQIVIFTEELTLPPNSLDIHQIRNYEILDRPRVLISLCNTKNEHRYNIYNNMYIHIYQEMSYVD